MIANTWLRIATTTLAVVAASGVAYEAWRLHDAARYDRAVAAEQYAAARPYGGESGIFAAAYALHLAERFQDSRIGYSRLERSTDRRLRAAALFNTGNTYLEQAARIDRDRDADRAVPLLELAKSSYRAALRADADLWDARYNLERALRLLPDPPDRQVTEVEGRQSPVRTIVGGDQADPWP